MPLASTSASGIASSSIVIALREVEDNTNNKANILPKREETNINEDYMLLELYYQVFLYNAKEAGKLARKRGENLIYKAGQIVLLTIPHKNRLLIEATRLPCRILIVIKGVYTLLSQYGPLKGRYQGSSLLAIKTQEDFGIPMELLTNAKLITLPFVVTLANNHKSISVQ